MVGLEAESGPAEFVEWGQCSTSPELSSLEERPTSSLELYRRESGRLPLTPERPRSQEAFERMSPGWALPRRSWSTQAPRRTLLRPSPASRPLSLPAAAAASCCAP